MDCKRLTLSLIALAPLAPSPRLAAMGAAAALSLMEVLFDLHGSNAVSPAPDNVRRRALCSVPKPHTFLGVFAFALPESNASSLFLAEHVV